MVLRKVGMKRYQMVKPYLHFHIQQVENSSRVCSINIQICVFLEKATWNLSSV